MKDEAGPAGSSASMLPTALLDYFEAPGKYQLTLRQPAQLFSSIREILQIASGRGAADGGGPEGERLLKAANFFVRAALLYPGADHYAVLGLPPGEAPPDLKERYRLLMRLIHPDFAKAGSADWPADAAVRVNRAYEALSSPVLRREYDDQLASLRSQRPMAPAMKPAFRAAAARQLDEVAPRSGKRAAILFGLAVGVPAVLLLMPRSEPEQLVQRSAPAASARVEAQPPAPADHALLSTPSLPPAVEIQPAPTPDPFPTTVASAAQPVQPVLAVRPVQAAPADPAPAAVATARHSSAATAVLPRPAALPNWTQPAQRPVPPPVATAAVVRAPALPDPAMATRMQEMPRPVPAPVAVGEPVPAPVVVAAVAVAAPPAIPVSVQPSSAPAGRPTTTMTVSAVPAPTLADAQPLLTQVLQMLESGSGEQLLHLLDGDARRQPGAQALSRQYEQLVRGGRPVHLTQVEFNGEPREGGVLLVTGRIRLHAGEPTIGSFGQRLLLRAEFAQRAGKVQLTALSGSPD